MRPHVAPTRFKLDAWLAALERATDTPEYGRAIDRLTARFFDEVPYIELIMNLPLGRYEDDGEWRRWPDE